jgi:hypothetical protein
MFVFDLFIRVPIIIVIYTAAIALIPARAYAHIRGDIPLASLNEAWRRSVSVLDQLAPFSLSASRCSVVLQKLNEAVVPKTHAAATADISDTVLMASEYADPGPAVVSSAAAEAPVATNCSREINGTVAAPHAMMMEETYFTGHSADYMMQDNSWFDSLPGDLLAMEHDQIFSGICLSAQATFTELASCSKGLVR